jgi:hypothetical protein
MRSDELVIHGDDVYEDNLGEFYGTPILAADPMDTAKRDISDMQQRVRFSFGRFNNEPIELLSGEVITDNTIRRSTAAEVVGEAFYTPKTVEGRRVTLDAGLLSARGVLITWRPNNEEIAVIHEEVA